MLGTGAVIVIREGTCMVDVARRTARFFAHESCGRCTVCRIGTVRIRDILERIQAGQGKPEDVTSLERLADGIQGRTFCPLGDAAVGPVRSSLKLFRQEYEQHVAEKRCPLPRNGH